MMNMKVAIDNGNSEQKMFLTTDGKETQRVLAPNVFARQTSLPNMDEVPISILDTIHEHLIASVEGQLYYIGRHALDSGARCHCVQVGTQNDKSTSQIVFVNTLAHIAGEAVARAYAEQKTLPETLAVHVDMATALPVSYYSAEKAHFFERRFTGHNHSVILYVGSHQVPVSITFDFVKVIPEGVTAAHAFSKCPEVFASYNEAHPDTPVDLEAIGKQRILHVAIGEGTTEFPVTKGIVFKPDFIDGSENGIGHAIDRVLIPFKREFGLMKLTRQDYAKIMRTPSHKYHDDAMSLIETALRDEAEDILEMAEMVIQKANNEVDVVAVYGGGSIFLRPALEKPLQAFCDRARIQLVYIEDEEDAVWMEAYGLEAFLKSKLFENLKKQAA